MGMEHNLAYKMHGRDAVGGPDYMNGWDSRMCILKGASWHVHLDGNVNLEADLDIRLGKCPECSWSV